MRGWGPSNRDLKMRTKWELPLLCEKNRCCRDHPRVSTELPDTKTYNARGRGQAGEGSRGAR